MVHYNKKLLQYLTITIIHFYSLDSHSQVIKSYKFKEIPFAKSYPNKIYFRNNNCDTIFGETFIKGKKQIWYYQKSIKDFWKTYYKNGKLKEVGRFKRFTPNLTSYSKKNLSMIKIGIWNYFNDKGDLILVIDYKKGIWDEIEIDSFIEK